MILRALSILTILDQAEVTIVLNLYIARLEESALVINLITKNIEIYKDNLTTISRLMI